jgi:hypothetical protein
MVCYGVLIFMQCASLGKDVKILLSFICVCILPVWGVVCCSLFNLDSGKSNNKR